MTYKQFNEKFTRLTHAAGYATVIIVAVEAGLWVAGYVHMVN